MNNINGRASSLTLTLIMPVLSSYCIRENRDICKNDFLLFGSIGLGKVTLLSIRDSVTFFIINAACVLSVSVISINSSRLIYTLLSVSSTNFFINGCSKLSTSG